MTLVKRRSLFPLICGILLLTVILLLPSCGEKGTEKPYDFLVTFNYNVGNLDVSCPDQYLGVKSGGVVGIEPGFNDDFKLRPIANYYIEGWYTPKLAADGTPEKDPTTGRVLLDKKWSFETDTVTADTVLYANLIRQSTLSFVDIATGEVVKTLTATPGTRQNELISVLAPKKDGYTLVGYYTDAAKTERFQWPFIYGDEDVTAYVDFLEGNWSIADSAETFKRGISGNKNVYVTADLDFSDTVWVTTSYNGTIEGNGHKLTGLTLKKDGSKTSTSGFGLFTTLGADANLRNLTIENLTIRFSASLAGSYRIAPIADEIKAGAKFDHVTVTGELSYDISKAPTSEVYPIAVKNGISDADMTDCDLNISLVNVNG
ncbi:MAG TPA: hypothetical protein DDW30_04715 [Clostridiales bacterium]|nr:hypothetical protein [Clostridiales bacterium]